MAEIYFHVIWQKVIVCLFIEREGSDLARCYQLVKLGVGYTGIHCTVFFKTL